MLEGIFWYEKYFLRVVCGGEFYLFFWINKIVFICFIGIKGLEY